MEKGAEAAEALTGMEIYYKRVTDHLHNQPDAARSHAFDKQRMDELIQALDGWDDETVRMLQEQTHLQFQVS